MHHQGNMVCQHLPCDAMDTSLDVEGRNKSEAVSWTVARVLGGQGDIMLAVRCVFVTVHSEALCKYQDAQQTQRATESVVDVVHLPTSAHPPRLLSGQGPN